jgi:hypothetical protein
MEFYRAELYISAAGHMKDDILIKFSRALHVDAGHLPPLGEAGRPVEQRSVHLDAVACLPWSTFMRLVARYRGDFSVQTLPCAEQYRAMALLN